MLYPYMTLADETEIVHSEMDADGRVRVCIERPVQGGFQSAQCELPGYKWTDVKGFSDDYIRRFTDIIAKGAQRPVSKGVWELLQIVDGRGRMASPVYNFSSSDSTM